MRNHNVVIHEVTGDYVLSGDIGDSTPSYFTSIKNFPTLPKVGQVWKLTYRNGFLIQNAVLISEFQIPAPHEA